MSEPTEQLLTRLHQLVTELDSLAKHAAGALAGARERLDAAEQSLQGDLRRHSEAVDEFVHRNVWVSIGVAATIAFMAGALTRRRD